MAFGFFARTCLQPLDYLFFKREKLSCLLPELEFDPQVKSVDGLAVYVLTDGACFLVDGFDEEPCSGFFRSLVVLDDEVLFTLQLVDVEVAALDEELSLGGVEKGLVDMIRYGLVGVGSYHGTISLRGNIYASRARYGKPHYRGRYRLSHSLFYARF